MERAKVDDIITGFIKKHHVLTLATSVDNTPYCSNMFYAWIDDEDKFVFTSSGETKHVADVLRNSRVAGSVVLETKVVGNIQGIQFCGEIYRPEGELFVKAKKRYLKRFPYASVMNLELWVLSPDFIKLTDNRLGFGKKVIWEKQKIKG